MFKKDRPFADHLQKELSFPAKDVERAIVTTIQTAETTFNIRQFSVHDMVSTENEVDLLNRFANKRNLIEKLIHQNDF